MDEIIEKITEVASKYDDIEVIKLFGSYARGDSDEKSDVDLAVFSNKEVFDRGIDFVFDIESHANNLKKYDIIFVDKSIDDEMRQDIEKEGIIIYKKF